MFPWVEYVSGFAVRDFFTNNADVVAVLVILYLGMVRYGPGIATSLLGANPPSSPAANGKRPAPPADPAWLRYSMIVWNLLLSLFSFVGALVIVPALIQSIHKYGLRSTVCETHDELTYEGPSGFWTAMFVLSKVPEMLDTFWLIIQKKKTPPFLHWYHHASVLLFAWLSYASGNSTMPFFSCMNIVVHAIMYFYFFLCAAGMKKVVRPFAPMITSLQILQMVGGSVITSYSYLTNLGAYNAGVNDLNALPCAVGKASARFGCLMYLSYLYLFSKMFVQSYFPSKKAAHSPAKGN